MGGLFFSQAGLLDGRNKAQNSGGRASGSSIVRFQKAPLAVWNWSSPTGVVVRHCRREVQRPSLPAPDSGNLACYYLKGYVRVLLVVRQPQSFSLPDKNAALLAATAAAVVDAT